MAGENQETVKDEPEITHPAPEAPEGQHEPAQAEAKDQDEKSDAEAAAAEPEPEAKEPEKDWRDVRNSRQQFQLRERDRQIAELSARIAQLEPQPDGQAKPTDPAMREDYIRRQAVAEASFNMACNAIYDAGVKAHADFQQAAGTLAQIMPFTPELIDALQEAGEPEKLIYQLGKNPNEAARIADLSPARQAVALAKFAAKASAPVAPKVSAAPAPIKPIGSTGGSGGETDPDKMSMEEWTVWRGKQVAKRQAAGERVF